MSAPIGIFSMSFALFELVPITKAQHRHRVTAASRRLLVAGTVLLWRLCRRRDQQARAGFGIRERTVAFFWLRARSVLCPLRRPWRLRRRRRRRTFNWDFSCGRDVLPR